MGFFSEAAYRVLLHEQVPERFYYDDEKPIGVFDKNHWTYSEAHGYGYPKNAILHHTSIEKGRVTSCSTIDVINERGNIGPIEGTYEDAEFRVLVLGDSWSAFTQQNLTWTDIFEKDLEELLGVNVEVVNFSRDGYGILQMFDLAADVIDVWEPDLTVFAFITNDLARVRTWRIPLYRGDVVDRVVTSFTPKGSMNIEDTYDTYLIHNEATQEWCEAAKGSTTPDEVVRDVYAKYQRANRVGGEKKASILALNHSYLASWLIHGNPFKGQDGVFSFPTVSYSSYALDDRYMQSLSAVKKLFR